MEQLNTPDRPRDECPNCGYELDLSPPQAPLSLSNEECGESSSAVRRISSADKRHKTPERKKRIMSSLAAKVFGLDVLNDSGYSIVVHSPTRIQSPKAVPFEVPASDRADLQQALSIGFQESRTDSQQF